MSAYSSLNHLRPVDDSMAPVQRDTDRFIPLEWSAEAWKEYAAQGHGDQSHERICERGGFGYIELIALLYDRIKRLEPSPASTGAPSAKEDDHE